MEEEKILRAFLHPFLRKPKSGLKLRMCGGRTMHRAQRGLDIDAQSNCSRGQTTGYKGFAYPGHG